MGWRSGGEVLEDRLRFVLACEAGEPVSAACAAAGISRECGYKWLRRHREGGIEALRDRSRAPHDRPGAMSLEVAAAVLALRRERPHWGPRKLRAVLSERDPEVCWPAASTMGDLLRREGLTRARVRRRRAQPREVVFDAALAPNDEWAIDFKGWFRTRDGRRCDPLTMSDSASRYLLECRIMAQRHATVRAASEAVFRRYGLPRRLRMDNGAPFASQGPAGLSRLSVWWVKLGIALVTTRPGAPQENGRHERMHATLQEATTLKPAGSVAEQQARFDLFRDEYNEERPHEALGQIPPGRIYRRSERAYPERVEEPWYDARHQVRRVRSNGTLKWGGEAVWLGEALAGEPVGLLALESGDCLVRFAAVDLGVIEKRSGRFWRYGPARAGRPAAPEPART